MQVPVKTLLINQIVHESATKQSLEMRRKDLQRVLDLLQSDSHLRCGKSCFT